MPTIPVGQIPGAAQDILQELQKQQKPKPAGPGFGQVLDKTQGQPPPPGAQEVKQPTGVDKIGDIQTKTVQKAPSAIETGFKSIAQSWSKDSKAMDNVMQQALHGKDFKPGELILLQNAAFKYSFELQAMSKVAETASQAVKTAWQTQV